MFNQIRHKHGRLKGFLRHIGYQVVYLIGGMRHFTRIDWSQVRRLVFVCKGNICRSAYAAARSQTLGYPATSFGLAADGEASLDSHEQ